MKKHLLFFSILLILFAGCSKDDNTSQEEAVIPENEKFLNIVNSGDGTETILSFEYNTDKNMSRMKLGQDGLYIFGYDNNRITSLDAYLGGTINFTFSYDPEGHINAFTQDDVVTQVTYNAAHNFYLYAKENGDEETIFLDDDGDAKKFVSYDKFENKTSTTTVIYEDGDKKGTLTNTNNPLLASCIAIPQYKILFLLYNISKKPIKTLAGDGILDFDNTFDEQGFLKSCTYDPGNGPTIVNYNYIKL